MFVGKKYTMDYFSQKNLFQGSFKPGKFPTLDLFC